MDILELKLVLPHLGKLLHRPRLAEKLSDLSGKRLVLVTAGAGYGKTTLVAQTLAQTLAGPGDRAVVWYRLDRFDRDVATFMGHLAHGLEKVFPGFIRNFPGNLFDTGSVEQTETGLLGFLMALEALADRETVIVLDDYYLLGRSGEDEPALSTQPDVHACLDFILERLPAHVRLVLISRMEPPLQLSTLRVRQQILEIHEPDLGFTREETASFFSQIHGRGLKENELAVLHRQIGGWAAGLVLLAAALKGAADPLLVHRIMETGGTRHHIFNFLEENLFQIQSADMQAFMIKTALMDPMETRICDRVLGIDDSRNRFLQMMEAHLMVFSMNDRETAFHYHHLFRDFLLEKSRLILSASEIHGLHLDIAGCLEAEKNSLALIHYIEAGAYDDAVRLLEAFELEFLIQGKIFFVRTCLEKIPKQVIAGNPRLLFMEAKQYSYFGRPDKSIACLTAACRIFRQAHSDLHLAKCLVDLGAQYYYTGHIPEARNLMVQVLDTARTEPGTYILAITYLTFFCAVLGNISEARAYESEARVVIAGFPAFEQTAALAAIDTSTTYIHYIQGNFEKSMALNLDLLARCEAVGLEAFLPLAYYHAAATDGILGNYQQGVAYAEKGIWAAEKIHLRDSQKGWIYMALSENHLGLGHVDVAGSHAQSALDIFRQPGNRWGMANAQDLLARISLARKDALAAHSLITRALDTIAGYGLPMTEAIITLTRARILIAAGSFKEARTCLVRDRRYLKVFAYYLCISWLLGARCCHALGQKEKAWKQFQKALAIARKKNLDRFVLSEAGDLVRSEAFYNPHSVFSEYLARLRARPGTSRTGLCVQVLGRFRVFAGPREIAASDWTSSKSLILFQYLLLQQSRGFVPKDVLVEMLWQNQDPDKAGKRFNTAMSQLRKILEPDLPARFPSTYVHRKKDCYRLSLGPRGCLDLTEFQVRAKQALEIKKKDPQAAFDLGREAVSLYSGPLLEEVLYQEWCTRLKEEETARFCSVCRMLVDLSRDSKDLSSGIVFAEKFLWADPYDEPMYHRLISFFLETGQTGQARKTLQACQQRMEELGCPLSLRTRALYKKISEKSIQNLDKI
jgi:ATP/maltotriose-dependent transcriptional regulator MalT/DNA-binding SARP family transcriptional activator